MLVVTNEKVLSLSYTQKGVIMSLAKQTRPHYLVSQKLSKHYILCVGSGRANTIRQYGVSKSLAKSSAKRLDLQIKRNALWICQQVYSNTIGGMKVEN